MKNKQAQPRTAVRGESWRGSQPSWKLRVRELEEFSPRTRVFCSQAAGDARV